MFANALALTCLSGSLVSGAGTNTCVQLCSVTACDEDTHAVVLTSGDVTSALSDGEHSVQVRIDDGDISVEIDGDPIPQHRIRVDDGRVVVLDEDGNEIKTFSYLLGGKDGFDFDVAFAPDGVIGFADGDAMFNTNAWSMPDDPPPVMLGITMSEPGPALRKHLGLDEGTTAMINGVSEGLPAHEAGLAQYDIIVAIDGDDPANPGVIREVLREMEPGDKLRLTVIQEGKRKNVKLELVEYDQELLRESKLIGSGAPQMQGRFRWMDPDNKGGGIFVAPDKEVFAFPRPATPNMEELEDRIRERLDKAMERQDGMRNRRGDLDDRLEDLADRMSEIEDMLERLLNRLDR